MAIDINGATNYLRRTDALDASNWPLTISAWFNNDAGAGTHALVGLQRSTVSDQYLYLYFTTAAVGIACQNTGGVGTATSAITVNADTWYHAAGVFSTTTSRTAYANGSAGTEDTTSVAFPVNANETTTLGVRENGSLNNYIDGRIAHVAVWNVALFGMEIAALADGFPPSLIRPANLLAYWPLERNDISGTTHADRWKAGKDLTETGTITLYDPPPRMYRRFGVAA